MGRNEPSDEQLMAHVAEGNGRALEVLYDRYAPAVMGLIVKILGDHAAAEEVVEETFWWVWRHADSFENQRGKFRSWMFSIAKHRAIDVIRHRKMQPQQ